MRLITSLLVCATLLGCNAPPEATPLGVAAPGHFSYATGYRNQGDGWDDADDQWVFGAFDADWRPPGWPVWIAGQMLLSTAERAPDSAPSFADSSGSYEFSLGLRRYTAVGIVEPWIGAGAALIGGSVSSYASSGGWYWSDQLDDDLAWGWYVDAGVQVPLSPLFVLGLALRHSEGGDLELFGQDLESGGTSVLFLIGGRF